MHYYIASRILDSQQMTFEQNIKRLFHFSCIEILAMAFRIIRNEFTRK